MEPEGGREAMGGRKKWIRGLTAALLCLVLAMSGAAAESGIVNDEDGGTWDYDRGIYTDPDGNQYEITDDSGGSSGSTRRSTDGALIIDTGEIDGVTQNADGSISVESGAIQGPSDEKKESGPMTYEEWQARMDRITERNGRETETFYRLSGDELLPVTVVYVGLARSMIVINGGRQLVDTCDLVWASEAPEDKLLAVVKAPKSGKAYMKEKTKAKSMTIDTCTVDRVVRVLKIGKSWAFVDHAGMRGYIQVSSLTFYPNERRTYETGYISVKGKTPSGETVWVRSSLRSNKQRTNLEEYPVGTPLTIFADDGTWAEVDVEGWHCFIKSKYVSRYAGSETGSAGSGTGSGTSTGTSFETGSVQNH